MCGCWARGKDAEGFGEVSGYLFRHLAELKSLTRLYWDPVLDLATVQEATGSHRFWALRALKCVVFPMTVHSLLSYLKNLLSLDITLGSVWGHFEPFAPSILAASSENRNLQDFRLSFTSYFDIKMHASQLLLLAQRCQQLASRTLGPWGFNMDSFKDVPFDTIASCLPNLRKLNMNMFSDVSAHTLITLGKCCVKLEECKIAGVFNLCLLGIRDQLLFPRLHKLGLFQLPNCEDQSATELGCQFVLPCTTS